MLIFRFLSCCLMACCSDNRIGLCVDNQHIERTLRFDFAALGENCRRNQDRPARIGFGRVWTEAALARGDRVAATARNASTLAPLAGQYGDRIAAMALDVTDKTAVRAAISEAHSRFGRLDVVINNAGYGLFGTIEEVSEAEARAQLETNLFGALWV